MQWQATTILDGSSGSESVTAPQLHLASPIGKSLPPSLSQIFKPRQYRLLHGTINRFSTIHPPGYPQAGIGAGGSARPAIIQRGQRYTAPSDRLTALRRRDTLRRAATNWTRAPACSWSPPPRRRAPASASAAPRGPASTNGAPALP